MREKVYRRKGKRNLVSERQRVWKKKRDLDNERNIVRIGRLK